MSRTRQRETNIRGRFRDEFAKMAKSGKKPNPYFSVEDVEDPVLRIDPVVADLNAASSDTQSKKDEKKSGTNTGGRKTHDPKSMTPEELEMERLLMDAGIPYDEYMNIGKGDQSISSWNGGDMPKSNAEGKKKADAEIARENTSTKEMKTKGSNVPRELGQRSTTGSNLGSVPQNTYDALKGQRPSRSNRENLPNRVSTASGQKNQAANAGRNASQNAIGQDGREAAPSGMARRNTGARKFASSIRQNASSSSRKGIRNPEVQNGLREAFTTASSGNYGRGTGSQGNVQSSGKSPIRRAFEERQTKKPRRR